jgi:hypothetical protein
MILVFTHLVELQCVDRSPIRSCLWLTHEQGVLRVVMPGSTGVLPAAYPSTVSLAFQSDRHPCTLLDLHPSPNSLSLSLSLSLSTNFRIRKVHFRMLLHKLLQQLILLTLVTRRLPLPLHLLVVHHLLHHPPRLAVQLRQLAVLWRDLGCVDLGRGGDDVGPPV